jgi:hypothetical protein
MAWGTQTALQVHRRNLPLPSSLARFLPVQPSASASTRPLNHHQQLHPPEQGQPAGVPPACQHCQLPACVGQARQRVCSQHQRQCLRSLVVLVLLLAQCLARGASGLPHLQCLPQSRRHRSSCRHHPLKGSRECGGLCPTGPKQQLLMGWGQDCITAWLKQQSRQRWHNGSSSCRTHTPSLHSNSRCSTPP